MASIDQIAGGNFQDSSGNLLTGTISFTPSSPAQTLNDGQFVPDITITYPIVAGNVPQSPLWGNDQLTPTGTYYIVKIYNSNGAMVRGPENWAIIGTSPIDLGTIVAYSPTISYPKQIPNELAVVTLTSQAAPIAVTDLTTLTLSGLCRVSWNAKVTTPSSGQSSLGPLTIFYTDADGVAQTLPMAHFSTLSGMLADGPVWRNGNSTATGVVGIPVLLSCVPGSVLQYSFGYQSAGATAMQFELTVIVEQM